MTAAITHPLEPLTAAEVSLAVSGGAKLAGAAQVIRRVCGGVGSEKLAGAAQVIRGGRLTRGVRGPTPRRGENHEHCSEGG
jgi:hypothetical protein